METVVQVLAVQTIVIFGDPCIVVIDHLLESGGNSSCGRSSQGGATGRRPVVPAACTAFAAHHNYGGGVAYESGTQSMPLCGIQCRPRLRLILMCHFQSKCTTEVGLELKEIHYCILQYMDEMWQGIWTTSTTGQFYRKIEPVISRNIKYTRQNRVRETTITRLRFGKCRLNEYLAKLNVTDSTKCAQCKAAVETVEHFLLLTNLLTY